ncbi:MAG TPA: cation diffusion facilitator family transporter [Solirubrobacteraceae bacterium]|jgi:cobalt-zinc-cadmium efflux system protein|nr:cation diffusion facilitator family transporter [Solirubrobacteraceae bacterium]
MAHEHAGHMHAVRGDADRGRLTFALALIVGFMAVEVAAGVLAHSLALLSDAGHMLADAGAIGFSLIALRLAARPAAGAMTFGFKRAEILSAQANGVTLLVLAGFIAYEAIVRLVHPMHVRGGLMLAVALAGIAVNLAAARALAAQSRESLNIEGSYRHILTDLYAFIGTAIAAGVILIAGFERADPIVSLLIAALMVRSGVSLVRAAGRIFLEAAPVDLEPDAIGEALIAERGVVEVHDLHVWEVTSGFPALSAHVLVGRDCDCHAARREMEAMLHARFGVDHTTLQVDHVGGDLLEIEPAVEPRHSMADAVADESSEELNETTQRQDRR